ncbi:MAG: hypothetical protein RMM53_05130 [Bacteroidia bacterium]|nr:hypothetical protein [Bacteroidia bacterium]MDW8333581.1 hypothetical protein [Bacteroidia bacterium]
MKFTIATRVGLPPRRAAERFDARLFQALAPPFPKIRLLRFEPQRVEMRLDFGVFRSMWESKVEDWIFDAEEARFVDTGVRLPPPLKSWRHVHRLRAHGQGSILYDEIEYTTGVRPLDWLIFPFLWAMMAYRRPIYRKKLR